METAARTLGDRYELRSLVATGGMGQVWRAHDRLLGRPVAVKVLRSDYAGDLTFLARFRAEARHTALLHHPAITSVFDYGETDSVVGEHLAYLVMELVEGESLSDELRRERSLSPGRVLDVLRQTATGLAAAHEAGVVHRDVKPGNLLVRRDGSVTVTDFGIAWSASSVSLTDTGQVIGTAHYLSPEQAEGRPATPASDVYALGMVGYELLAGRRAFQGESSVAVALSQIRDEPPPLPPTVPADVRGLIASLVAKDPRARPADGEAVVAAIDRVRRSWAAGPVSDPDAVPTEVVPGATFRSSAVVLAPAAAASATPVRVRELGSQTSGGQEVGAQADEGPADEGPADEAAADQAPGRRRRSLVLAALVAVLLLTGVGVALLLGAGASGPTAEASGPTATSDQVPGAPAVPTPGGDVVLDAAAFLGRPVDDVVAELTALGLQVTRAEVVTADSAAGVVVAVDPAGTPLAAAAAVTVTAAVAPTTPPELSTVGGAPGAGAASVPAVTTEAPVPTTAAPAPGNGNGNGNGNGGPGNGGAGGRDEDEDDEHD